MIGLIKWCFIFVTIHHTIKCDDNLTDSDFITSTNYGQVKGVQDVSRNGSSFIKFLGIPYARPPIGKLRFKTPQRPKPWKNILEASKEGNDCLQKNYLFEGSPVSGSEDCLYLNVFTRKLYSKENSALKPVMVYIHGGGWFAGSGATTWNGPEYLMDQDIVFVTLNYRLGVFGFLSTGNDVAPGNWGLKDQLLALKWVQENIRYFGGDPASVTLFGQSAGAASIHYHMLSHQSKGLFHRAIAQSGTALVLWAQPYDGLTVAKKQAEFVNCPTNDITKMFNCLQDVDALTLLDSGDNFKIWSVDPLDVFTTTIEQQTPLNKIPYLSDNPYTLLKQKKIANPVPLITGVVPEEGAIRGAKLVFDDKLRSELNFRFLELGPILLETIKSVKASETGELFQNMTDFYMDSEREINDNTTEGFSNMYSDRAIIYSSYQTAMIHMTVPDLPVYFYHFNYKGVYSYTPLFSGGPAPGVGHCDDLIYLLRTVIVFPDLPLNHSDVQMSQKLVKLWTNFAKYGDPTPVNDTINNLIWTPLPVITDRIPVNSDLQYLNIENSDNEEDPVSFKMQNYFYSDRMQFWENLPIRENL